MEFVSKTDVGKKRNNNEDFLYSKKINENVYLYIVADGLGGYSSGEVASYMAVNCISKKIEESSNDIINYSDEKLCDFLRETVNVANTEIYLKEKEDEKYKGMATTIVAVLKVNDKIYYFSIGDSRLYYITEKKDNIVQITNDDTYVNELIKNGVITEEEAINHPQKHILTKAVGIVENLSVTVNKIDKKDGYLLLCSDGVTNMLSDIDILDVVRTSKFENLANNIVDIANGNGGIDNITVIIIKL